MNYARHFPPDQYPTPLKNLPSRISRRRFLVGSGLAVGALALYSNEVARHELEVTHRSFFIRNLPPAFDGFRIVQISDIHLDEFTEDFFLNQVITRINTLSPDMILVTGDFCSRGPLSRDYGLAAARRCAHLLTALTCTQRFGILGNHDVAVNPRLIRTSMEDNGTPLLVDQFIPLERQGQRLFLAGVDSMSAHPNLDLAIPDARLLGSGPDRTPILLMAHEPDYMVKILAHPRHDAIDLVLSGHTHGGQICLPGGHPLLLPPNGKLFAEGHHVVENLQLYVNRGIGTVGVPLRLNCPPEITLATLHPATQS